MVKVTRGSDPMKAIQGNRTHGHPSRRGVDRADAGSENYPPLVVPTSDSTDGADQLTYVSFIDWISDTCPQGYTDLQSPVKCLDHSAEITMV